MQQLLDVEMRMYPDSARTYVGTLVSTLEGLGSSLLRANLASKQTLGWSGYGTILRSGPLQRPLPHPSQRIPLIWYM